MKLRILTLAAVVCSAALTGCSGGLGSGIFGRGAACGGGCSPAAGPSYDYAPESYGYDGECCNSGCNECVCGTDGYAGYDSGMSYGNIQGESVPYENGWDSNGPNNEYIVPGSESTRTIPVPQPHGQPTT